MKTILTFLCCMVVMTTHAQFKITKTSTKQVVGLEEQLDSIGVVRKFGVPHQYYAHDDEGFSAWVSTYDYSELHLTFADNKLVSFSIDSPAYVFTIHGDYRVQVGDRANTFLQSIPPSEVQTEDFGDEIRLFFKSEDGTYFRDDSLILRVNTEGIITMFYWYSPI